MASLFLLMLNDVALFLCMVNRWRMNRVNDCVYHSRYIGHNSIHSDSYYPWEAGTQDHTGGGGQSYDLYRNSPAYIMYHKLQWTSVNARNCQGNCIDWRIGKLMLVPHETACTLTSRLTFYSKATTRSGDTMHTSAYYYCTILFWV